MYVLLIYREEADSHEGMAMHKEDPFAGIEIIGVSVEEITLDDIDKIKSRLPNPANTKFHIDQV